VLRYGVRRAGNASALLSSIKVGDEALQETEAVWLIGHVVEICLH
jgi:hypothetical protein